MDQNPKRIMVAQMKPRSRQEWTPIPAKKKSIHHKRLLRNTAIFAAVSLCLGVGTFLAARNPQQAQSVMSHLTAGFEYDETLGRLQFVSNVLPDSAMVFLSNSNTQEIDMTTPVNAQVSHAWNPSEPWLEYAHVGDVSACQDGEVMTIVKNHEDEYTVRIMHANGYESVYSGLSVLHLKEHDSVKNGQTIGTAAGFTAFELRRDGLSVLPAFSSI